MATQQGTVSIELALQGLAVVERGLDNIKKSFGALGQNVKNLQKDFDSVGKGLNTVIKDLKRAFTEGGFNKLKDQFKESVSTLKTALPMMLRGSLLGFTTTLTSSIAGIVKKAFTALPKHIISQLTGIYNTIKSITGFDQFFNAGSVLQGSIALANYTKTLKAQSDQTAIDIQQTLNLRTAMELVGVESDNLGKRVSYMGKQLTKAFGGSAPDTLKVLKELGITESMIAKMDTAQRFTEIANRINSLKDPAKQARAAIMLFDRAGNELLPFFRNFNKSTEDAKKILGDFPSILGKNQQEFVKFSNAVSNLQIKRQQFFAGFLDVAQEPFNALLDKVLSINFTSFGQKVADNFKQTLNSIQQGDFKGFIENFSLEFADAFEKGFNIFMDRLDTINFDPIVAKFVDVGIKVIGTVLSKGYKIITDGLGSWFAEKILKLPDNDWVKSSAYLSWVLDGINKIDDASAKQLELRYAQEKEIHDRKIALEKEAIEAQKALEAKALQERDSAIIDSLDKIKQKSKDVINDSKMALMSLSLDNTVAQSNPFLSATDKRSAQIDNLKKQYVELENQIISVIKTNETFSDAIKENLENIVGNDYEFAVKISDEKITKELNNAIKSFVNSRNVKDLDILKKLVPEDQLDSITSQIKNLANVKIQADSVLNSSIYDNLNDSIRAINGELEQQKSLFDELRLKSFSNDVHAASIEVQINKEQIKLLNEQLNLLLAKQELAYENNHVEEIEKTATAIRKVRLEIVKLNAQPSPVMLANIENIRLGLENANSTIEKSMASVNADWTRTEREKWVETNKYYNFLIKNTQDAIKAVTEEQKQFAEWTPEYKMAQEELRRLNDELFNLKLNLSSMGANPDNLIETMRASFTQLKDEFGTLSQNLADGFTNSVMSMRDSFSDFMYDVFRGAKSGKEALDEMWLSMGRTALRAITDTISNFVMQHTVMTALEYAFSATTIALNEATNSAIMAENSATAAAMAEMWKPSAIWASIASMGGAVAVGLAAMAGIMGIMGGFAEGGRVRGGKQISWLNEEGSEFVVSARSPLDNDKWLEAANRGVNLDDLAIANAAFIRQSESQQSNAQPQTVKQITVRTSADIRREWKEGGLIEFVRSENLRRGWAS